MGLIFGLIKKLVIYTIYFLIFAAIIVVIPNLPPYTSFTRIEIDPPQPFVGPLALNGALNNVEKLYTDKLLGPEAFNLYNGEVYTSLATGEIIKLSPGGHVTFVTKIGQPCSDITQEDKCGRPLGFVIEPNKNQMYVADAYHGIWKVDMKTDKKQLLVSPHVEIGGRLPKLFNSVALDGHGNLYWTDSTSDFSLKDGCFAFLSDPSGRLLQYDAVKNESKVLMDKLWFANGVIVSPDNQFVVVAESFTNKLHKYYINGPNKGKSEVFVTGLPGTPDNIRPLPDGSGLLVALYSVFDEDSPMITRTLAATPHARKFLARILRLVEIPFEFINSHYPHFFFQNIVYKTGHFKTFTGLTKISGLIQTDWNGNIVASYYNTDGSIAHISDAIVYNDKLYMGQPHSQNFIASVTAPLSLRKAFTTKPVQQKTEERKKAPESAKQPKAPEPVKVVTPKPVKEEAKPTPIPPKPTPQAAKPTPQPKKQTVPPVQAEKKPATTKPQEKGTSKPTQDVPKASSEPVKTTTHKPKDTKENVATTTAPSKPASKTETKPVSKTPQPKPTTEKKNPTQKPSSPKSDEKAVPPPIPIIEEIPSDTIKPNKETLKVIKKEGPTEIPNPNL